MKKKLPFITIITPTYNRADLIESAILSVINQRRDIPFEWEMIIVDDGSTDNTSDIVNKYIKKHPKNIRYFYQKNSWIPGVARNVWLDCMSLYSDYITFLDSDDELKEDYILSALKKWEILRQRKEYDSVLWLYFLCEDEDGNVIYNKQIFQWTQEKKLKYSNFLHNDFGFELVVFIKSSFFLKDKRNRFSNKVITEAFLWSKMWQYIHANNLCMYLFNHIWRFYRTHHSSEQQITKTISLDRFMKNAIWNEEILKIIWSDLLKFWYKGVYANYLFRIWINRLLYWNKQKWLQYLKKSFMMWKNLLYFCIFLLSKISRNLVLYIYKKYINF